MQRKICSSSILKTIEVFCVTQRILPCMKSYDDFMCLTRYIFKLINSFDFRRIIFISYVSSCINFSLFMSKKNLKWNSINIYFLETKYLLLLAKNCSKMNAQIYPNLLCKSFLWKTKKCKTEKEGKIYKLKRYCVSLKYVFKRNSSSICNNVSCES